MRGYGVAWQKSVFYCNLGPAKRQRMETRLRELAHHGLDQILIMDLGPREKAVRKACLVIGRALPAGFPKIVII
jgi:CRISPR/Cas system-associated endoribonuclease Cas2